MSLRKVSFKHQKTTEKKEDEYESDLNNSCCKSCPCCGCYTYERVNITSRESQSRVNLGELNKKRNEEGERSKNIEKGKGSNDPINCCGKQEGGKNYWKSEEFKGRKIDESLSQGEAERRVAMEGKEKEERMILTRNLRRNESEMDDDDGDDDRVGELDAGFKICSKSSFFTSSKGDPHVNEHNNGNQQHNMETLTKTVPLGGRHENSCKEGRKKFTEARDENEKDFDSFYETGSEEMDSYLYIDEDEDKDRHHFSKYFDGRNFPREEYGKNEEKCLSSFRRIKSCRESGNDQMKGRKTLRMLINGPSSPPSSTPPSPSTEKTRSPAVTTNGVSKQSEVNNCGKVNGIESNNYDLRGKCDCQRDIQSRASTGTMDRFKSGYAAFRKSFDPRIVTFNCCSPSPPSFTPSPSQSDLDSPSTKSYSLQRDIKNGGKTDMKRSVTLFSTKGTVSGCRLNQNQRVLNHQKNIRNSEQQRGEDEDRRKRREINPNSSPTSFSLTSASFSPSLTSSSPSDHPSSSLNDSSSSSSSSSSSNPKRPSILRKLLSRMGFSKRSRRTCKETGMNGKNDMLSESPKERKMREKAEAIQLKKEEEEEHKRQDKREEQVRKLAEEERRKLIIMKTVNESKFKRSKSLPRNVKIKKEVETQTLNVKSASTSCTEINKLFNRSSSNLQLEPRNANINCNGLNCGPVYGYTCVYSEPRGRTITRTTCCYDKSCSQSLFITSNAAQDRCPNRMVTRNGILRSQSPMHPSVVCPKREIEPNTLRPISYNDQYGCNDYAQIADNHLYSLPSKRQIVPRKVSPCSYHCQPLYPDCRECISSINTKYQTKSRLIPERSHHPSCLGNHYQPIVPCPSSTSHPVFVPSFQSCKLCPTTSQDSPYEQHQYSRFNDGQDLDLLSHGHGLKEQQFNDHRSTSDGTFNKDAMICDHHLGIATTGTVTSSSDHHYPLSREPSSFSSPVHRSFIIQNSRLPSSSSSPSPHYSTSSHIPLPLPPPSSFSQEERKRGGREEEEKRTTVSFSPSVVSSRPSFYPPTCPGHRCHDYNHANQILSPFYRQGSLKLPPSSSSYYRTYDTTNCRRSFAAPAAVEVGNNKNRPDIMRDTPWTPGTCNQCSKNKSSINNKINTNYGTISGGKYLNEKQTGKETMGGSLSGHLSLPSTSREPIPLHSSSSPSFNNSKTAVSLQSKSTTTSNEYSTREETKIKENHGEIEREQEVKK